MTETNVAATSSLPTDDDDREPAMNNPSRLFQALVTLRAL